MKIAVFTGNQPRHHYLIQAISDIGADLLAFMESTIPEPGGRYPISQSMQRYFMAMSQAESSIFGPLRPLPRSVRTRPLPAGDPTELDQSLLEDALYADLVIFFDTSYLCGAILERLKRSLVLNVHMGISPYYRGTDSNFWALYDGRADLVGATIHQAIAGVDGGPILFHALPPRGYNDGFSLAISAVKAAHDSLVARIVDGSIMKMEPLAQDHSKELRFSQGSDFTESVVEQYLLNQPDRQAIESRLGARHTELYVRPFLPSNNPSVRSPQLDLSIVVATKNRRPLLHDMLQSVRRSAAGLSYEIIVVEGGSTDGTAALLSQFPEAVVINEASSLGPQRNSWPKLYNLGFKAATGVWTIYASDDITFEGDCLQRAVMALSAAPPAVAGGIFFYRNEFAETGWERFGIDFLARHLPLLNYGLIRRELLASMGYLSTDYGFYCADGDITYRLAMNGYILSPLPGSLVTHHNLLDTQKQVNLQGLSADVGLFRERWAKLGEQGIPPSPRRMYWDESVANVLGLALVRPLTVAQSSLLWRGISLVQQGQDIDAGKACIQQANEQGILPPEVYEACNKLIHRTRLGTATAKQV